MNIEFYLHKPSPNEATYWDVSELVGNIQYTTDLNGQPGKLTCTFTQNLNLTSKHIEWSPTTDGTRERIEIETGALVRLRVNGKWLFYGYVFTKGYDQTGAYTITAYDQTRYLKNSDSIITDDITASQLFEDICIRYQIPSYKIVTPTQSVMQGKYYEKATLYDILNDSITRTGIQEGVKYFVRDEVGQLTFTSLAACKTNLILGDESLVTDYKYEISIDKETYNQIKMVRANERTEAAESWIAKDSRTIDRWGLLQYLYQLDPIKIDDEGNETSRTSESTMSEAEILVFAERYLHHYNRQTQTMSLSAVGTIHGAEETGKSGKFNLYTIDVAELRAGDGFTLQLKDIGVNQELWVNSITHTFNGDTHMMRMDVHMGAAVTFNISGDPTINALFNNAIIERGNIEYFEGLFKGEMSVTREYARHVLDYYNNKLEVVRF